MFLFIFLLISTQPQYYFCQILNQIDDGNIIGSQYFKFDKVDYLGHDDQIIYGLWSRYNPFSIIDSDQFITSCYNLHHALEMNTRNSNFLYYDCLDLESLQIKKIVQFVDEEDEQHNFILELETNQYENTWYYFGVSLWINQNKFEVLLMRNLEILLHSNLGSGYPFYDSQLIMKFGGGLDLNNQQRVTTFYQNLLFSAFPGKLCFYSVQILSDFLGQGMHKFAKIDYQYFDLCGIDWEDIKTIFNNQIVKFVDIETQSSQNEICESFSLDGWIKGISIQQSDQNFLYKFIKISVKSESELKTNDNVCPFQLLYIIQNDKLYLQILTYSYTYPSLYLDFQTNPFLIKKEFELELQRLYQWHYISVRLKENFLTVQITFYDREIKYQQNYNIQVNHFHNYRFKISVGNLFQNKINYINMEIFDLTLTSKWTIEQQQICHYSCKTCEGPTKQDCLSCDQALLRFYIPEIQSCVCPENLLDHTDGTCKDYYNLQFSLVEYEKSKFQCKYGYFKYDEQTCVQCPSNPNTNAIFCFDCLQNPLTWKLNPVCNITLLYNNSDTQTYKQIDDTTPGYYLFDLENMKFRLDYDQFSLISPDQIYDDYLETLNRKLHFCYLNGEINDQCFYCNLYGCRKCQITIEKWICLKCSGDNINTSGEKCIPKPVFIETCLSPYYLNFQKNCKLCEIENCLYCFEYLINDLQKNTLFKDFDTFIADEFYSLGLGCALCQEGFQFNFQSGKCMLEQPKIQNCIRSFINMEGVEICTLADSKSFEIAPEIINCQQKIEHCYSCIQTPQKVIMCILCEDGYLTNINSGQCLLCSNQNSKKCIQGRREDSDGWVQLLQSFIMQFLNKNYFYPNDEVPNYIDQIISCEDGYKLTFFNTCDKYCNSDCLKCEELLIPPYGFKCMICPLNYYNKPSRSFDQRNCLICPKLCSICESRLQAEINKLNQYFYITDENVQFTHKCIQQIQRHDVYIDSEFQIAKLILEDLDNILNFDVPLIQYYDIHMYETDNFLNSQNTIIDLNYCNQIGVGIIQLSFIFESTLGHMELRSDGIDNLPEYPQDGIIENTLKKSIFSLQLIIFNLIGIKEEQNLFSDHLITKSFDSINITQIHFFLINPNYFIFYNDLPLYLTIQNCTFQNFNTQTYGVFSFNTTYYKFIQFKNLTFQNLYLIDSIVFNISGEYLQFQVIILDIIIQNCEFINSSLISIFQNYQEILIKNLTIINCIFKNTNLFDLNTINSQSKIGYLNNIQLLTNQLHDCNFIKIYNFEQFSMSIVLVSQNKFYNSTLFTIQSNFQVINLIVKSNIYINSFFLTSSNQFYLNKITYEFNSLELQDNQFSNSQLFLINPYYNQDLFDLQVIFKNIVILNNEMDTSQSQNTFLFEVHSNQIQIDSVKIYQEFNILIFYMYDIFSISIKELNFSNFNEVIKIPFGKNCQTVLRTLIVIKVFGFKNIYLENVYIRKLQSYDSSLFEFTSNFQLIADSLETIKLKNIIFQDNTLLKFSNVKRMSLIYVYSELIQTIILDEINFISNLLHQTADDLSENIAGLIYVNSQRSNVIITNIVSKQNSITNSSCSFLNIITNSLYISNYTIDGLNIFNEQQLQKFMFDQEIFNLKSQEEIQQVIQKTLSIQTKGSACQATVTELVVENCIFQNIFAYTIPLFDLKTEGKGLITLQNLVIRNIDVVYDSNLELKGSIAIYSFNSQLNLNFINIIFDQVRNKLSSSILSITPSQRKNNIVFKNVKILNSFSLKNSILLAEFSGTVKEFNFVYFQNVSIIQTKQAWLNYFQKIGQINNEDLLKVINDNGMINVASCTLIIENLFVEGVIQSPVIKVLNAVNLQIIQCNFFSVETFFQFDLIQVRKNKFYSMKSNILNNEFRNLQLYQPDNEQLIQKLSLEQMKIEENCQFNINNLIFYLDEFYLSDIVKIIQSQQSLGSLINLQSVSNQTYILIQSLKLLENSCDFCYEGLISINIQQIQRLKINEVFCIKNQIINYGCINIQSSKIYQNQFTLLNSVMALNVGYLGVGITFTNLKGIIYRTLIFNNSGISSVGGINIKSDINNFKLNKTFIFQNQAEQCGGVQLSNYANLEIDNFVESFALFNKAKMLANNIVEAPTQLALKINNQLMKHQLKMDKNITQSILDISAKRVIQQNIVFFTNFLMIPSNQKIAKYQIFDQQTLSFIPYMKEISLYFLNSQREQLGNFEGQNCTVFQSIIQLNGALINQSKLFLVSFDNEQNKIDLGDLYFTFDPYESSQYIQEIEILCNISEYQALSYKFKTKSFYCQLGEFYTNGGCQICDYKFGFYSVSYNATKCSIFDKTKFSEITSNSISFLPGFWRPDYLSDYTEFCYQKQRNCLGGWSAGDSSCLQGYLGGLCYECDFYNMRGDGYYFKNLDNDECSLCDDSNNYIMYFLIVSLIAMISIFMTLRSIEKTNQLFNNLKVGEKFGKIIFKLNQDHESFLIKMFVNYLWIFSLIFTYNINFSVNLNIVDQASNTSYSMANNLDCLLAQMQEINIVYIRLIATIFFIILQLLLVYLILVLLSQIRRLNFNLSNITNTSLYLYISNNAALTKQFCTLIAKKTISNIDFVQGNMALRFYSISHQNWINLFVLPGLFINGCVIPFLLIGILFLKRGQLDQIKIRKYFCYLFNEYNEANYYWEQIKIWQKTALIIIMVYFEANVLLKTTLFGLTLIIYQFLANYYKPYIILSLNKLDYQAGQLCSIAIFLAASRNVTSNSLEISNILQITIAILCILLIFLYTNMLFQAYFKKYKLVVLQFLLAITKIFSSQSLFKKGLQNMIQKEQNRRDKLQSNYGKLKNYLIKSQKLNSQFRKDQTQKTDQTFQFVTNQSIKLQMASQAKE